ncbi:hypothetical protein RB653_004949 [Dictyostelium firmibasis]|uniref:Reverse transcriptase n=1 Tax=Dictyostelium firmibasis TaxID=79012 RepID=A0AAN7Z0K6_9MYCE
MNKPRLILDPKKVNETIKVILDTGSNISLINRKLLTEEMKSMIHNSKDIVEFPLLSIKESNVQDVNIQLGDDVYKFIVTDVEVVDVLIGNDILKESIIDQQKQLLILNNRRYRITYQKSKEYKCNLNTEEEEYINSKFEEDEDIKDKVIEIVENLPSTICDILVKTNPSEEEIEIITNFISEEFEDVIVEKLPEISDQLKKSRRNKIIHNILIKTGMEIKPAKEAESALGLFGFFRRVIPKYAEKTAFISAESKVKGGKLSDKAIEEFIALKEEFKGDNIVAIPIEKNDDPVDMELLEEPHGLPVKDPDNIFNGGYHLYCDVSDLALSGVLYQIQESRLRPIWFHSRKLSETQKRYSIGDREFLSIVDSLKKFQYLLMGKRVTIYTDHQNLLYVINKTSEQLLSNRQINYIKYLEEFNAKLIHISGNKNGVADFLSRKYDSFQWDASFLEKIKEEQEGSEWLKEMKNNQNLCIEGTNDIYYLVEDGIRKLIIIEKETIDKIVREYHDAKYSGHKSFEVVYNNIRHDYYFRDMYSIIKRYIKSCAVCQLNINRKETGLLQSLEIPYEVWRDISMDFVSMPKSKMAMNGFQVEVDQCCMIVCRLSKMIHAIPCAKTINAEHTAQLMLNHVFRLHGYPRTIVSDRDPKFISEIWRLWAETMDSKLKMTVAHRAKGDGQTERKIQEFVAILTKMSSTYGEGWADLTALAEFAMNSSISKVTKMSPFQAVYGFNPPTPVSHFNTLTRTKIPLSSIKKIIRDNILDAQITSQKYYNKNRGKAPDYKIGDKVFVKRKYFETGLSKDIISKKLESKNCGPFKIIEVNGNNVTLDLISYPRKHNVFNVDQLVQLFEDDDWIRNEISMPDAEETEESTYEVEKIINYDRKHRRYLAKFVGYPEPEWVKEEDANCDELIKEYWEVQNEKLNSKQGRESRQQENLESIVHPETSNISLSDRSESNFQDPEIPENFNKSKAGRKRVNNKGGESEVVKSKVTKSGRTSKPPSRF